MPNDAGDLITHVVLSRVLVVKHFRTRWSIAVRALFALEPAVVSNMRK